MSSTDWRVHRVACLVSGAALLIAACNPQASPSPSSASNGPTPDVSTAASPASAEPSPKSGGSIKVGISGDTTNLLPFAGEFGPEQHLIALALYDGLAAVGSDYVGHPHLAESITPNADLTEWTVKLRDGVTFTDGAPVTAAAIKDAFDTYTTSDDSNTATVLAGTTATVLDPLTISYTLPKPNSAFPELISSIWGGYVFSPDAVAAAGEDAGSNPVGTGPYMVGEFKPGEKLVLNRNPAYWQAGLPYLDGIEFDVIPDDQTRIAAFQSGGLDAFVTTIPEVIEQALALQADGKANVIAPPSSNGFAVLFNTQRPPFDDVRIRTALTQAIDQNAFIAVRNGTDVLSPKDQLFSSSSPWYSADVGAAYPAFDPAASAALLQEYMDDPQRSDGKAVGDPVVVTHTCERDPAQNDVNQALVDAWNSVGFNATWPTTDPNEFIFKVLGPLDGSDEQFIGDYDTACWALGEVLFDPAQWLSSWFGQPVDASIVNVTDYTDPEFVSRLDALLAETDPAARKATMDEIGLLLNQELPNAWLGSIETAFVTRPELKNVDDWTLPDGSDGFGMVDGMTFLSQAWLDE